MTSKSYYTIFFCMAVVIAVAQGDCSICGEGQTVTNAEATIDEVTCLQLEQDGLRGIIDCDTFDFPDNFEVICGCAVPTGVAPAPSPLPSASDFPTQEPSATANATPSPTALPTFPPFRSPTRQPTILPTPAPTPCKRFLNGCSENNECCGSGMVCARFFFLSNVCRPNLF